MSPLNTYSLKSGLNIDLFVCQISYFKTSGPGWQKVDPSKLVASNNFPKNIDAAFSLADGTVYLFKDKKYCKRPFESKVEVIFSLNLIEVYSFEKKCFKSVPNGKIVKNCLDAMRE
jgi:hypothetical protein